jgi:hypothetical protein
MLFQPRNRPIERSGTQPNARERFNILHHGVAVFIALGEARKNQKCRV